MDRAAQIDYLSRLSPFINIAALVRLYNETQDDVIDYNSLRCTVNGTAATRLSDERLTRFVVFLRGSFARTYWGLAPAEEAALAARAIRRAITEQAARLCAQIDEDYR